MGFDLNRHWTDPSPWAHPTLHAVKNLVMQYDRDTVNYIHTVTHTQPHYNIICLSFLPTER